jgi:hypothetical protein
MCMSDMTFINVHTCRSVDNRGRSVSRKFASIVTKSDCSTYFWSTLHNWQEGSSCSVFAKGVYLPYRLCNKFKFQHIHIWSRVWVTTERVWLWSIGLCWWYSNITITTLDIIHFPVFLKTQRFGDWIVSLSSSGTYSGSTWRFVQNCVSSRFVIRFINILQLVTTINSSAIAISHTVQFTIACA